MWVFLNNSMLSIVEHRDLGGIAVVRARRAGDIDAAFTDTIAEGNWDGEPHPPIVVEHTPNGDYPYRANIPKEVVAQAMYRAVKEIDYDNFKASIPDEDASRHNTYLRIWAIGKELSYLDR